MLSWYLHTGMVFIFGLARMVMLHQSKKTGGNTTTVKCKGLVHTSLSIKIEDSKEAEMMQI